MKKKFPDWREWNHIPTVKEWQAAALSLNLNPWSLKQNFSIAFGDSLGFSEYSFPSRAAYDEFELRRRVLAANIQFGQDEIRISEFAAWALSIGWDIPLELAALASKQGEQADASAPQKDAPASPAKVGAGGTAVENPHIPGKLPRVAIGRLAVTAAWQIEHEFKRAATADKVIERLQAWATDGEHPDILLRAEPRKRAVIWMTKKTGLEKDYDVDACGKTLNEWRKSLV